jgi:hypothetical protein
LLKSLLKLLKYLKKTGYFFLCLLVLAVAYQTPVTYTLDLGQNADEWAVIRGFGDPESNQNFGFRWTTAAKAELFLPDLGWPARVGVVGLAPRPDGSSPDASIDTGKTFNFIFNKDQSTSPPEADGRITIQTDGFGPHLGLTLDRLVIGSDLFQPAGDPRNLGLVINRVFVQTGSGIKLPPLTGWLGWSLAITLFFFFIKRRLKGNYIAPGLALAVLALVVAAKFFFPEWWPVYGPLISWGIALPLATRFLPLKWKDRGITLLLVLSVVLVGYELAWAPFTLSLHISALLLTLPGNLRFGDRLQNINLLISCTAPAGWLFWQNRLPRGADLLQYHLYWINELDLIIRQGNVYPHWAPDFTWQQGWTVFNFYPPSSRYLPTLLHLSGMIINNGVLIASYALYVAGAIGAYFWCREILRDNRAAVLGSLAFFYMPHFIRDFFAGGGLANFMGGTLLPWIAWLITRLVRNPSERRLPIWLGVAGAALALTSTPQLMVFMPVMLFYTIGLLLLEWRSGNRNWKGQATGLVGGVVLAAGLSAFFLFPATFEISGVGLKFTRPNLDNNSKFWTSFTGPFDFSFPISTSTNGTYFSLLPTLHLWLALAGLLVLLAFKPKLRPYLVLVAITVAFTVFLQQPASRFLWEFFSPLTSVQFTARLFYTLALFVAPLIGGLALSTGSRILNPVTGLAGVAVVGLMLVACFSSFDCPYWPYSFDGTLSQKALTEQVGNGDVMYLPKDVASVQEVSRYFSPEFEDGRKSDAGNALSWHISGPDSYRLTATLGMPGAVDLPVFWFKDWWIITGQDGREYLPEVAPGTGHIRVKLPPGNTVLTLKLQDNLLHLLSYGITLLTLFALTGFVLWKQAHRWHKPSPAKTDYRLL